jgi:hypothetical protein
VRNFLCSLNRNIERKANELKLKITALTSNTSIMVKALWGRDEIGMG